MATVLVLGGAGAMGSVAVRPGSLRDLRVSSFIDHPFGVVAREEAA